MKGSLGLIVAVVLGVLGGILNLIYLNRGGEGLEQISFLAVNQEVQRGEVFKASHFDDVGIPKNYLGNIDKFAVKSQDLNTVVGQRAPRNYSKNEMLLQNDLLKPPPARLELQESEVAVFVPIDTRNVVTSLIIPGETTVSLNVPTAGSTESVLGPFDVLSVGNRLGSLARMESEKIPQRQENVLTIVGSKQDIKIKRLQAYLKQNGGRPVEVVDIQGG